MKERIGVLIVDSDVVMRQLLVHLIREEATMTVVGVAAVAQGLVDLVAEKRPRVLLLDLECAGCETFKVVQSIRASFPDLPIIALSHRSSLDADRTMEALHLGVDEFLTKPDTSNGILLATRHFSKRLVPMIRAVVPGRSVRSGAVPSDPYGRANDAAEQGSRGRTELVVIGGGTGGPRALQTLLPGLPAGFPIPILVVQHMPRGFSSVLARRLDAVSEMPVREAVQGVLLKGGQIWLAPGGRHLSVVRDGTALALSVHRGAKVQGCRPSIDVLFHSAQSAAAGRVLAVLLSGHGLDGTQSALELSRAGGTLMVQDEPSSLVWELPGFVASAGAARVVPIYRMADEMRALLTPGVTGSGPEHRAVGGPMEYGPEQKKARGHRGRATRT